MSSLFGPGAELRQRSADHADDARALHQLVKDTRRVVEESRRLLESPMWEKFDHALPEPGGPGEPQLVKL